MRAPSGSVWKPEFVHGLFVWDDRRPIMATHKRVLHTSTNEKKTERGGERNRSGQSQTPGSGNEEPTRVTQESTRTIGTGGSPSTKRRQQI
jgi:hypothetical protein